MFSIELSSTQLRTIELSGLAFAATAVVAGMDVVLTGDSFAVVEELEDRVLDDPFIRLAHFESAQDVQGFVDAFFDFSKAVPQASGVQKYFADGDEVMISFFRLVEMRHEPFLGLAAQGLVRVADQQGLLGFRQVA